MCKWRLYSAIIIIIECNTEGAMETVGEVRSKMAENRFASSDEIVVYQLKKKKKNKRTTKTRKIKEN